LDGIWFKKCNFGGTGPFNAPLVIDSAGKIAINATDFTGSALITLTKGGITTKIANATIGSYTAGMSIEDSTTQLVLGHNVVLCGLKDNSLYGLLNTSHLYCYSSAAGFAAMGTDVDGVTTSTAGSTLGYWAAKIALNGVATFNSVKIGYYGSSTEVISNARAASFTSLTLGAALGTAYGGTGAANLDALAKSGANTDITSLAATGKVGGKISPRILYQDDPPAYTDLLDGEVLFWYHSGTGGDGLHLLVRESTNLFHVALGTL
jgi:hypothetical protein